MTKSEDLEKEDDLKNLYGLLDDIRSKARRCYEIASRRLEQKDSDICDHIGGQANLAIKSVLKELYESQLRKTTPEERQASVTGKFVGVNDERHDIVRTCSTMGS